MPAENKSKRLLSYKEAAEEYGQTVWYWRELVWKGELPVVLAGRKHLLDRKDIDALVDRSKHQHLAPPSLASGARKERQQEFYDKKRDEQQRSSNAPRRRPAGLEARQ